MLDQHEITLGTLCVYAGFILGIGLLALAQILGIDDLARWAIATLMVTGTYSVHRSLAIRYDHLRAFNMGREYEQGRDVGRDVTSIR